ncbi:TPA: hypothetical protein NJ265_003135 [Vibrio parahaemolyticus]|uniref:MAE_28990/MAE_18760 family HEPN-like nuclease n=2 Tax=Vibrio parahaemolyticus TaxID=670 RepID=UPI001124525C|nr:MAE_28990/MAE_18760 family HEPN-like nuclease [Vibrio parahaemolyticus]MBE4373557.1 hypothetical protein [Vibrio parahaemolyticus]TOE63588.1 hypothetical protein CGJ39_14275 [Vibrio parahaemolyticus]TOH04709.1 hypothetical protein CGI88_12585 [Vibrio parahaemolyticus]HCE1828555.1 hypothetical protein [Vibrio parahaemolyticus]HCE5183375.1 hypothetical protein [Vibrio parahaemolyticus]
MSKIRTVEALVDKLDKELSWRRLEISAIKTGIRKAKGNVCKAYIRSAIPLVYAHWEGFIKESASLYLEFVSGQRLKLGELNNNLSSITIDYHANKTEKKHVAKVSVVVFAREKSNEQLKVPYKSVIDTKSNLNFETFDEICWQIGLDTKAYKTKEKFINEEILKRRNCIAHGERLDLDEDDCISVIDNVMTLMSNFKTDVENCAVSKGYKKEVNSN